MLEQTQKMYKFWVVSAFFPVTKEKSNWTRDTFLELPFSFCYYFSSLCSNTEIYTKYACRLWDQELHLDILFLLYNLQIVPF